MKLLDPKVESLGKCAHFFGRCLRHSSTGVETNIHTQSEQNHKRFLWSGIKTTQYLSQRRQWCCNTCCCSWCRKRHNQLQNGAFIDTTHPTPYIDSHITDKETEEYLTVAFRQWYHTLRTDHKMKTVPLRHDTEVIIKAMHGVTKLIREMEEEQQKGRKEMNQLVKYTTVLEKKLNVMNVQIQHIAKHMGHFDVVDTSDSESEEREEQKEQQTRKQGPQQPPARARTDKKDLDDLDELIETSAKKMENGADSHSDHELHTDDEENM